MMSMPFTPKVKFQKVGNSYMISIPSEIYETLKWVKGDLIELDVQNELMTAKKVK